MSSIRKHYLDNHATGAAVLAMGETHALAATMPGERVVTVGVHEVAVFGAEPSEAALEAFVEDADELLDGPEMRRFVA